MLVQAQSDFGHNALNYGFIVWSADCPQLYKPPLTVMYRFDHKSIYILIYTITRCVFWLAGDNRPASQSFRSISFGNLIYGIFLTTNCDFRPASDPVEAPEVRAIKLRMPSVEKSIYNANSQEPKWRKIIKSRSNLFLTDSDSESDFGSDWVDNLTDLADLCLLLC